MKNLALATALSALGAATTTSGIVLPQGKNLSSYSQHLVTHPLPREPAVKRSDAPLSIPVYRHSKRNYNNPNETLAFAESQLRYVQTKWAKDENKKRQTIGLSDYGADK